MIFINYKSHYSTKLMLTDVISYYILQERKTIITKNVIIWILSLGTSNFVAYALYFYAFEFSKHEKRNKWVEYG